MKNSLLIIGLLISGLCFGQSEKKAYVSKVKELHPSAVIVNVEIKHDYVEIEYLLNGKQIEIGMGLDTKILYTETESEIPEKTMQKIKNKLNKEFFGWIIDEYAIVEMSDTSFFKVELINDGVEENAYFTMDGKFYKAKNIEVNENWNIKSLSNYSVYKEAPYSFLKPDKTFLMPNILKEISGISLAGEQTIFCVQDESGIVFKYDLLKEELTKMLRFTDLGDFEDLAVVGDLMYVLRSDGTLFHFNFRKFTGKIDQTVVPMNSLNVEGLCFDKTDQKMYIVSKDQPLNGITTHREVYAFTQGSINDLKIELTIEVDEIKNWMAKNYPSLQSDKIQFNPSAIAIHPITREMYILSASNRLISVYKDKKLQKVYTLPAEIYYKPEGIQFSAKGDLYLSSEGIKNGYVEGQVFLLTRKLKEGR